MAGTLSFLSSSVIITGARQARLTLSLPAPAPAAGDDGHLTSEDPLVASVPALVVIQANTTSTTVPVTGVAAGSTIIHASALPDYPDTTVSVIVH